MTNNGKREKVQLDIIKDINNPNSSDLNTSNIGLINNSIIKKSDCINQPLQIQIKNEKNSINKVYQNKNTLRTIINDSTNYSQGNHRKSANGPNLTQIHKLKLIELTHIKLFKSLEYKRYKNNEKNQIASDLNVFEKAKKKIGPIRPSFKKFSSLTSNHQQSTQLNIDENKDHNNSNIYIPNVLCKLCLKANTPLISFACGHNFCSSCIFQLFQQFVVSYEENQQLLCPSCGKLIDYKSLFKYLNDITMIILFIKLTKENDYLTKCLFCLGYALSLDFFAQQFNIEVINQLHLSNVTKCENGHLFCLYCRSQIEEKNDITLMKHNCLYINMAKKRKRKDNEKEAIINCIKCRNIIKNVKTQQSAIAVHDKDEIVIPIHNLSKCPKCNLNICLICECNVNIFHFYNPFMICFLKQNVNKKSLIFKTKYTKALHHLAVLFGFLVFGTIVFLLFGNGVIMCIILKNWFQNRTLFKSPTKDKTKHLTYFLVGYLVMLSFICFILNIVMAICLDIIICCAIIWALTYNMIKCK